MAFRVQHAQGEIIQSFSVAHWPTHKKASNRLQRCVNVTWCHTRIPWSGARMERSRVGKERNLSCVVGRTSQQGWKQHQEWTKHEEATNDDKDILGTPAGGSLACRKMGNISTHMAIRRCERKSRPIASREENTKTKNHLPLKFLGS